MAALFLFLFLLLSACVVERRTASAPTTVPLLVLLNSFQHFEDALRRAEEQALERLGQAAPLEGVATDTFAFGHAVLLDSGKTPNLEEVGRFVWGPGDDLLSHGQSAISSARRRFTVLFGMGRGGANALWSPGILE